MTWPEKTLWAKLRAGRLNGLKFRRQHPVLGHILDFACPSTKVAIELDGASHDDTRQAGDERKNILLKDHGWLVLHFPNNDVSNNLNSLLDQVLETCERRKQPTK